MTHKPLFWPDDFTVNNFSDIIESNSPSFKAKLLKATKMHLVGTFNQYLKRIMAGQITPTLTFMWRLNSIGVKCRINPDNKTQICWSELRDYMERKDITQACLAEKLDLHKGLVNQYVAGTVIPTADRAEAIAKVLGVSIKFDDWNQWLDAKT